MSFISVEFLLCLAIVVVISSRLKGAARIVFLLSVSLLYYLTYIPAYVLILLGMITLDYFVGLGLSQTKGLVRKILLVVSLLGNLGVLAAFKYLNFFSEILAPVAALLGRTGPPPHIGFLLPVGLSFHTFQSMAYVIEVYRGKYRAERNIFVYALYVMFFPQLVAGPIERPGHLIPQLRDGKPLTFDLFVSGARLILWGIFKKNVIADRLGGIIAPVIQMPGSYGGLTLAAVCMVFSLRLYADFSGYTDIAIGSARMLGIDLSPNFRLPYLADSIRDFWRRWHMSLTGWFRDYVYIPLGGNRCGLARTVVNILVVFVLSGLWHGANWTFVVWGLLHGMLMVLDLMVSRILRLPSGVSSKLRPLAVLGTFVLVSLSWLPFISRDIPTLLSAVNQFVVLPFGFNAGILTGPEASTAAIALVCMISVEIIGSTPRGSLAFARAPRPFRWIGYYALIVAIVFYGIYQRYNFIYFQF